MPRFVSDLSRAKRCWKLAVWLSSIAALTSTLACAGKKRPFENGETSSPTIVEPDAPTTNPGPTVDDEDGNSLSTPAPTTKNCESGETCSTQIDSTGLQPATNTRDLGTGTACIGDAGDCHTASLCDAGGNCPSTCPGCVIAGVCVASGTIDQASICNICAPDRDPLGWSSNGGATCEDGSFCTVDDVCGANGCAGRPRDCEDGIACNGVSTCDEMTDSCSPDVNACPNGSVCNTELDACVTTCAGCLIAGVCVSDGAESANNPCLVCNRQTSTTAFSTAVGKTCGASASDCSRQDTCASDGNCQRNDLPAGTPCGSSSSSACDQPDTCDGNGRCQQRTVANDTPCDDGAFCTVNDECRGGQCIATGNRDCGLNRRCNETTDQCQCQGCLIGNTCVSPGTINPSNSCQVCDPNRNSQAFSANTGAFCGQGASECSAQDTCNNQGVCNQNHFQDSRRCASAPGGTCRDGQCVGCTGCVVNGACVTTRSTNPTNVCEICDPNRNASGYSANVGATCGRGAEECSRADTCNEQRQCADNHLPEETSCSSKVKGRCQSGACRSAPFDCLDVAQILAGPGEFGRFLPSLFQVVNGEPPAPTGGTIEDGVYEPTLVTLYHGLSSDRVPIYSVEFRAGSHNMTSGVVDILNGGFTGGPSREVGTYETNGTNLLLRNEACIAASEANSRTLQYSVSGRTLRIHGTAGTNRTQLVQVPYVTTLTRR